MFVLAFALILLLAIILIPKVLIGLIVVAIGVFVIPWDSLPSTRQKIKYKKRRSRYK